MTYDEAMNEAQRRLGFPEELIRQNSAHASRMIRLESGSKADFIFEQMKPGTDEEATIRMFMAAFSDPCFYAYAVLQGMERRELVTKN